MDCAKIIIFFAVLLSNFAIAKSKLPVLALKQRIQSVRFISKDGKYTYYMNSQGKLILSTNFNIRTVLKSEPGVDYMIHGSPARKNLLVEMISSKHTNLGLRKANEIFSIKFGKSAPTSLGKGTNPKLHLNDVWASHYNFQTGTILFQQIDNPAIRFQIKLINERNPYFTPQVVMLNDQEIIFSDLNEIGIAGLLKFTRNTGKITPVFKADDHNQKLEICLSNKSLFLGLFPLKEKGKSIIFKIDPNKPNFESPPAYYQSSYADIGNILCQDDSIYFIKQIAHKERVTTEAAAIKEGKVSILSDLSNASQIISMDGNILIPYRSKIYILEGNKKLGEDNLVNEK